MISIDSLISINLVFYLIGGIAMLVAVLSWRDRSNPKRYSTGLFWFLFAFSFLFGDLMLALLGKQMTYRIVGVIVLLIAAIAGANLLGTGRPESEDEPALRLSAQALGNKLFLPALAIPVVTVLLTLFAKDLKWGGLFFLDQKNLTLAALSVACVAAVFLGSKITGGSPWLAVRASRRLVDAMGWALLLPQMLAARDLPFPRLSAYSYWTYAIGGIVFFGSIFFSLAPSDGWFMYPPLSSGVYSKGINADFWLLGIGFIEISAIAGAISRAECERYALPS